MKIMWLCLVALTICMTGSNASASSVSSTLTQVRVEASGKGFATFAVSIGGGASCGTSFPASLAFDTNTAAGRAVYALLLSAKSTNAMVTAYGTGSCSTYPGSIEEWYYGSSQ